MGMRATPKVDNDTVDTDYLAVIELAKSINKENADEVHEKIFAYPPHIALAGAMTLVKYARWSVGSPAMRAWTTAYRAMLTAPGMKQAINKALGEHW
jgi:hypothetical protein